LKQIVQLASRISMNFLTSHPVVDWFCLFI
jgi:hypothetical protein